VQADFIFRGILPRQFFIIVTEPQTTKKPSRAAQGLRVLTLLKIACDEKNGRYFFNSFYMLLLMWV
jgi:hypothetical protein